jgi:hypothetical protein
MRILSSAKEFQQDFHRQAADFMEMSIDLNN